MATTETTSARLFSFHIIGRRRSPTGTHPPSPDGHHSTTTATAPQRTARRASLVASAPYPLPTPARHLANSAQATEPAWTPPSPTSSSASQQQERPSAMPNPTSPTSTSNGGGVRPFVSMLRRSSSRPPAPLSPSSPSQTGTGTNNNEAHHNVLGSSSSFFHHHHSAQNSPGHPQHSQQQTTNPNSNSHQTASASGMPSSNAVTAPGQASTNSNANIGQQQQAQAPGGTGSTNNGAAPSNTQAAPAAAYQNPRPLPGTVHRIRLVPHLENARSLPFEPIIRDALEGGPPLRVGRFTDRQTAMASAPNAPNALKIAFRSKVVSRGHAEIWVESGGRFFLKDTKSSSGTFLNHVRLANANVESRPFALKDGDIIQLGIDYQGGQQEIYRCVKIKVEIHRDWQAQANAFNNNALRRLQAVGVSSVAPAGLLLGPVSAIPANLKPQLVTGPPATLLPPPPSSALLPSTSSSSTNQQYLLDPSSSSGPITKTGYQSAQYSAMHAYAASHPPQGALPTQDCCICLFPVTVVQALFVAPCSHAFHYKCMRPMLLSHHPGFSCPLCRAFADLESDVEVEIPEGYLKLDGSDSVPDGMEVPVQANQQLLQPQPLQQTRPAPPHPTGSVPPLANVPMIPIPVAVDMELDDNSELARPSHSSNRGASQHASRSRSRAAPSSVPGDDLQDEDEEERDDVLAHHHQHENEDLFEESSAHPHPSLQLRNALQQPHANATPVVESAFDDALVNADGVVVRVQRGHRSAESAEGQEGLPDIGEAMETSDVEGPSGRGAVGDETRIRYMAAGGDEEEEVDEDGHEIDPARRYGSTGAAVGGGRRMGEIDEDVEDEIEDDGARDVSMGMESSLPASGETFGTHHYMTDGRPSQPSPSGSGPTSTEQSEDLSELGVGGGMDIGTGGTGATLVAGGLGADKRRLRG